MIYFRAALLDVSKDISSRNATRPYLEVCTLWDRAPSAQTFFPSFQPLLAIHAYRRLMRQRRELLHLPGHRKRNGPQTGPSLRTPDISTCLPLRQTARPRRTESVRVHCGWLTGILVRRKYPDLRLYSILVFINYVVLPMVFHRAVQPSIELHPALPL